MPAAPGNSNVTKKGTKQRSFNLDDATFAIVEQEAERLHITNSAALSMILNDWVDAPAAQRHTPAQIADAVAHADLEPDPPQRDLSYLIPSETASTFNVNDPANDPKATGKPSVKRTRSKLDDKINDDTDILRGPKDD